MDKQEEEIWKDIPGYEGLYKASSLGNIKSLPRLNFNRFQYVLSKERVLTPRISSDGYGSVALFKNKKRKDIKIHQLVAMSFLGHTPNGNTIVVNHIDGNVKNNNLDNIEIVTHRENCTTKFKKNKHTFSSQYPGVFWSKCAQKWQSGIWGTNGKRYLGLFNTEEDASAAYQVALSNYLESNKHG